MNNQHNFNKVDVAITEHGKKLPIVESFYSIQGEGFHTGKAAYFIRIGGCDIACHWCDSKVSWNASIHPLMRIEEIAENVLATPARSVVVTGAEPALSNLDGKIMYLKIVNYFCNPNFRNLKKWLPKLSIL
jgi:7-carboxy-7-deazaguanine synthase